MPEQAEERRGPASPKEMLGRVKTLTRTFSFPPELQDVCDSLKGCLSLREVHLSGNPLQQEGRWRYAGFNGTWSGGFRRLAPVGEFPPLNVSGSSNENQELLLLPNTER